MSAMQSSRRFFICAEGAFNKYAKRVQVKPSSGEKRPVDGFQWREAPDDGLSMCEFSFS